LDATQLNEDKTQKVICEKDCQPKEGRKEGKERKEEDKKFHLKNGSEKSQY
jgi:hypothetical protein